ncbi:MAG: tetratricopeptide repeat protein [Lewinellaceae bacterium]|nr:tetratricopeptide repeat protein [Lewinellaceae bacterium]
MKFIKNAAAILFILIAFSHFIMAQSLPDRYMQLADDFRKNAQPDSALVYYEKASVEFQKTADFEKLANAFNQMGIVLTRQDKYDPAKKYLEMALEIGHNSLDSNNLTTSVTYISLGVVYAAEEDFEQSLKFHYQALAIRLFKLGEYSAEVATSYGNIGNVYFNSKNYDKALDAHIKAMNIREKIFGENSAEIIESYTGLGNAYREKKDYKSALDYFDNALQNKILQRGLGHKDLARYYKKISDVYYLMDDKVQGDLFKTQSEN